MITALISLAFLLLFAEFSSANFKRLAPVLEAWDQSKRPSGSANETNPFPWLGGWEKLAAVVWAFALSIPLLVFTIACHLFLEKSAKAGNFVIGSAIGSNIIGLSVAFGLVLFSGPLTFFRVRTVTSPVFLLLATVAFAYTCLNGYVSPIEAAVLLLLITAYGAYFRRFSSEWKHYERAFSGQSLLDSTEGILPVIAVICMGIGFFLLAILVAAPFVHEMSRLGDDPKTSPFRLGAHIVGFALSFPWLARCALQVRAGTTSKAILITSISHGCLLNVLFIPALASILGVHDLAPELLSVHLPILLILTGVFVSALLIEKERGGRLPWVLVFGYIVYTVLGIW